MRTVVDTKRKPLAVVPTLSPSVIPTLPLASFRVPRVRHSEAVLWPKACPEPIRRSLANRSERSEEAHGKLREGNLLLRCADSELLYVCALAMDSPHPRRVSKGRKLFATGSPSASFRGRFLAEESAFRRLIIATPPRHYTSTPAPPAGFPIDSSKTRRVSNPQTLCYRLLKAIPLLLRRLNSHAGRVSTR
jgi:hypothetical protein